MDGESPMKRLLAIFFTLAFPMACLAQEKPRFEGREFFLPAGYPVKIFNEEPLGNKHRGFEQGQVCLTTRESDTLKFVKETKHSVSAIVSGSKFSEGDGCPNNILTMFTTDEAGGLVQSYRELAKRPAKQP